MTYRYEDNRGYQAGKDHDPYGGRDFYPDEHDESGNQSTPQPLTSTSEFHQPDSEDQSSHGERSDQQWSESVWEVDDYDDQHEQHFSFPHDGYYADGQAKEHYDNEYYEAERVDPHFAAPTGAGTGRGIKIYHDDLRDVGHNPLEIYNGTKLAKVCATLTLFVAVGAMLVLTLKPDVSAYDIVSMETYEGQQTPEWTLDPEDVEGCGSLSACFKQSLATKTNTAQAAAIGEIPARAVAQPRTTKTDVVAYAADARMRVSKQWSNIRSQPGMTGSIITSINSGLEVEVVGKFENWYEIVTTDGRAIKGFMHKNTLTN